MMGARKESEFGSTITKFSVPRDAYCRSKAGCGITRPSEKSVKPQTFEGHAAIQAIAVSHVSLFHPDGGMDDKELARDFGRRQA